MTAQKEIGSFLELQFATGKEFYQGEQAARLNTGRAGILHALKLLKCKRIRIPLYQCETVKDFLLSAGITVSCYRIDWQFEPLIEQPVENGCAILIVNYFGIMSKERMCRLAGKYKNVIIDNAQAFFAEPVASCMNVYSARKFIGVSDGAYVIGNHAQEGLESYRTDYSSDTALFLLQRIEYGCEGRAYENRTINEERLAQAGILKMSKLTYTILDGTDYGFIIQKRKENFNRACQLFQKINLLNVSAYYDKDCVPMVYPLVVRNEKLLSVLLEHKIFQGRWWSYLLDVVPDDSFEYFLSKYMIPVTIDQRYGTADIEEMGRLLSIYCS